MSELVSELGERLSADTLRFVRQLEVSQERVWRAITTPDGIAAWLGRPVAIEAFAGGRFEIQLTADTVMDGRVLELEPNRRLALIWHETSDGASLAYGTQDGDTSLVTFELSPHEAGGTTLVLTHRYIRGGETMTGFAAGWHALLEALGAFVAGQSPVDPEARYTKLKPVYEAHLASAM